jgi:hypothetical protein
VNAVLLDCCGRPEEGRLLVPDLARRVLRPRDLRELDCFELVPSLFPMKGGANTYPYEGLDNTLARITSATWYMRLFTSQTSTTVPSDDSKLTGSAVAPYTSGTSPVVEPSGGGYAAVSMAPGVWGANVTQGANGRRTTASQQSFPQSTGSWGSINGFFLATAASSTGQNTGVALYYANFSDGLSVLINGAGYTLQVTPFIEADSSQ